MCAQENAPARPAPSPRGNDPNPRPRPRWTTRKATKRPSGSTSCRGCATFLPSSRAIRPRPQRLCALAFFFFFLDGLAGRKAHWGWQNGFWFVEQAIYDQCDGLEYETSANVMDLRFVPDEMEFEQQPRDSSVAMPAPGYAPKEYGGPTLGVCRTASSDLPSLLPHLPARSFSFNTAALQHSKVKLSWDETDSKRLEVTKRKSVAGASPLRGIPRSAHSPWGWGGWVC